MLDNINEITSKDKYEYSMRMLNVDRQIVELALKCKQVGMPFAKIKNQVKQETGHILHRETLHTWVRKFTSIQNSQ